MVERLRKLVCIDTRDWIGGEEVTWTHCADCYELDCLIHRLNERMKKLEQVMEAGN